MWPSQGFFTSLSGPAADVREHPSSFGDTQQPPRPMSVSKSEYFSGSVIARSGSSVFFFFFFTPTNTSAQQHKEGRGLQQLRISEVLVHAWLSPVFLAAAALHIVHAGLVRCCRERRGGGDRERPREERKSRGDKEIGNGRGEDERERRDQGSIKAYPDDPTSFL